MTTLQTFSEKLKQRRSQMLIHSYLYYLLDNPIISDEKWQEWANELADMQKKYPNLCKINFYDEDFEGWDGSSGYYLSRDAWVAEKAMKYLTTVDKP